MKGWARVGQRLLQEGATTEVQNSDGRTPLHLASDNGHEGMCRVLLAAGADMFVQDQDGYSPWDNAEHGNSEGVMVVFEAAKVQREDHALRAVLAEHTSPPSPTRARL